MSRRKRIGLIMPADDATSEPDFCRLLGTDEFSIHGQRLWDMKGDTAEERMDNMNLNVESAVEHMVRTQVDALAYCCTTGSFYRGPGWDIELVEMMESKSGLPAVATTPSAVEALHHLGAKKVSVVTPYPKWNNDRLADYLTSKGFEVLNVDGHPDADQRDFNMSNHDPETVLEFGVEKCHPEADVLFCSCTGRRSLEVAEKLEKAMGKPVVTANQATIWLLLRKMGWDRPIEGYGQLLLGRQRVTSG